MAFFRSESIDLPKTDCSLSEVHHECDHACSCTLDSNSSSWIGNLVLLSGHPRRNTGPRDTELQGCGLTGALDFRTDFHPISLFHRCR
jgi:hypothetical protein